MTTLKNLLATVRKMFSGWSKWWSNQPEEKQTPKAPKDFMKSAIGNVVCISDGPNGVFAIVQLREPRGQKATFSVTKKNENDRIAWRHNHPPHVHQRVKLYDLSPSKKKKHWFAHMAERYR